MSQSFFLGQLRLALVAVIAYAGGKGWLTPTDAGLATALLTSLGPLLGPWAWSIYANINQKLVPQHSVVIDPVITNSNVIQQTAVVQTDQGTMTGKVVGALLIAFVLSMFLAIDPASAQIKRPQITGDVAADTRANLGLNGTAGQAATSPLANILGALDDKVLPDLQYALKLAIAGDSKVTAPCYQAWIDIINKRKVAVTNADGTPLDLPQPRIITDFEKAVELRNALQPDSDFSIKCAPVVAMVKLDLIAFMGKIIAGGAGLATLVPGL